MSSLKDQLKQIDEAITAVLVGGQEYRHEGRTVRRADLGTLYKQREAVAAQIERETGGNTAIATFGRRG